MWILQARSTEEIKAKKWEIFSPAYQIFLCRYDTFYSCYCIHVKHRQTQFQGWTFFLKISWLQSSGLNRWLDWQVTKLRWKVKGHLIHLHLLQLWKTLNCSCGYCRPSQVSSLLEIQSRASLQLDFIQRSYCSDVTNQLCQELAKSQTVKQQILPQYSGGLQWCVSVGYSQ